MLWSLEKYCSSQQGIDVGSLPESSRLFLKAFNLPSVHPFCSEDAPPFELDDVPPMGRLEHRFEGESIIETLITGFYMVAPALLAMAELWLRLLAGALSPIGILYMIMDEFKHGKKSLQNARCSGIFPWICAFSVASSLVLLTDTLYVLNNGKVYGIALFAASVVLSIRATFRYNLKRLGVVVTVMVLLASRLVWDYETKTLSFGDKVNEVRIEEGLYYDSSNAFVTSIVQNWPEHYRTYNKANGATPWMSSGDVRTGLPFLVNHLPQPEWNRLFLKTDDDEYISLDICFPESGFNSSNPIYMVLHGLNGGSDEEYIRDLAFRRRAEGATIVVMVARGLMDLPIRG
jgi:hypothetical protein